jgi:hypothetical protein
MLSSSHHESSETKTFIGWTVKRLVKFVEIIAISSGVVDTGRPANGESSQENITLEGIFWD